MELRGSKTEKNLWEAFAGESPEQIHLFRVQGQEGGL